MTDFLDVCDVFMYRDSSVALLLGLRLRLKAAMGVLGGMIQGGVTLARSLELTIQWDRTLGSSLLHLRFSEIFAECLASGIGEFLGVVQGLHRWFSEFIHQVVYIGGLG